MTLSNLGHLQRFMRDRTKVEAAKAVEEGRVVSDVIDGVNVELKYEGESGRGTIHVYSGVFLNGERFGTEVETHPWSFLKEMTVTYYCGGLMLAAEAQTIIAAAELTAGQVTLCEEDYPPEPPAPPRYEFQTQTLENVVKLFIAAKRMPK